MTTMKIETSPLPVEVGQRWTSTTGATYLVLEINAHGFIVCRKVQPNGTLAGGMPLQLHPSTFDGRHMRLAATAGE